MADKKRTRVKGSYLYYKDKPLVRENDTICYGYYEDGCILIFEIMSHTNVDGIDVPKAVLIQIINTENGEILKQSQKEGLFEAFNYGMFWYENLLNK